MIYIYKHIYTHIYIYIYIYTHTCIYPYSYLPGAPSTPTRCTTRKRRRLRTSRPRSGAPSS